MEDIDVKTAEQFFDIDEETKTAPVDLAFSSPDDIFEETYITKTPLVSDVFLEEIRKIFATVPNSLKVDMTLYFDDMGGYTEEELANIFSANLKREYGVILTEYKKRQITAISMMAIGIVFFVLKTFLGHIWTDESFWNSLLIYFCDLAATVTIWEGLTILIIEQRQETRYLTNLKNRFGKIRFTKKETA